MTNFSNSPEHVRVDFFKPESGKWYMTEMLDMGGEYNALSVHAAVRNALARTSHGRDVEKRWIVLVLEPYHVHSIPVLLTPGRASYSPYPEQDMAMKVFEGIVGSGDYVEKHTAREWADSWQITLADSPLVSDVDIDQDTFVATLAASPSLMVAGDIEHAKKAIDEWLLSPTAPLASADENDPEPQNTGFEWAQAYDVHITDPDGWNYPGFVKPMTAVIGQQEFLWRLSLSTSQSGVADAMLDLDDAMVKNYPLSEWKS